MSFIRVALVTFLIYAVFPTCLVWLFRICAFRQGNLSSPNISLTFDIPIDPITLPQLLDLLRAKDVKATFFVGGAYVDRYPAIVERIATDGHELGLTNYSAANNWVLTPRHCRKQIEQSAQALKRVLGDRFSSAATFYRPPRGRINLYHILYTRKTNPIALWSLLWKARLPLAAPLKRIRNGSIIAIQESAKPLGSSALQGIREALDRLQFQGYQFLTVGDLSRKAFREKQARPKARSLAHRLLFAAWKHWEQVVHRLLRLESVYTDRPAIFRIRRRRYHGSPIRMRDGNWLCPGHRVAELHLVNTPLLTTLENAKSSVSLATQLARMGTASLTILAEFLQRENRYRDITAIYGITMIYRGAEPLGFTVEALPSGLFRNTATLYLRAYLLVMHPGGLKRLRKRTERLIPHQVMMSKEELFRRYLPQDTMIHLHRGDQPL